jgi:multiple sugar transport system ATP-binding protein
MSRVRLDDVTKTYDGQDRPALARFSLDVAPGEFLVLVGPSGCGKSTALRSIAGLETPDSGRVWIGERDVTDIQPRDRDIAMVFQNYALYPHMTVFDNLAFGLKLRKTPKDEIDRRVREAAGLLGLDRYLDRKPKALSGGERQRVALGRALVRRPAVFLFDEPLSNLDAQLRVHMRAELHRLHQQLDATMIYVTHDQVEAMTLGDRIAVLKSGLLQQVDAPLAVYERPVNRFVAGFLGSPAMNFVDAVVDGAGVRVGEARWAADGALAGALGGRAGEKLTAGVRPEHLVPVDGPGALPGTVEFTEVLGAETLLYVKTSAGRLVVRVSPERMRPAGTTLGLAPEPGSLRLFDAEGLALGLSATDAAGAPAAAAPA